MKKSDMKGHFLSVLTLVTVGSGLGGISSVSKALPLDSTSLRSGTLRGIDADNPKIQCAFSMGSIRHSPSNKRYRSVMFSHNGNTWNLTDFDPKKRIPLIHYNQQGAYGYDVWFRSYLDEQHFARIWMFYPTSKSIPASVQLYAVSKKTAITRLLGECSQMR
jgi:hypothetical protein